MIREGYEAVVGLEVHAELKTATKIFCACPTSFGAEPNTSCCPVCMGLPGALPTLNRAAVKLALRAGLALGCEISRVSRTDRKQYFYPDLPKAYQISQDRFPLCRNGELRFRLPSGDERRVGIIRIHIEEDAGKLFHGEAGTRIDCNRCGVPLIEIVTSPDLRSGEEAGKCLKTLRGILLRLGVSDGRMQEGSLRCDANVSVRKIGDARLGQRVEIKNINSFSFVERAVDYEAERQIALLEAGKRIFPETRRYDERSGTTMRMRGKETAEDYRFFPEPDLPPFSIAEEEMQAARETLPELPDETALRLTRTYGIGRDDADLLAGDLAMTEWFERAARAAKEPSRVLHLLTGDLLRACTTEPFFCPVSPQRAAELSDLLTDRTVNSATGKKLLQRLLAEGDFPLSEVVRAEGLEQIRDEESIRAWCGEVLAANGRAVADYRAGKTAALRALQGQLMAKSRGRADPELAETILTEMLRKEGV